MSSQNFKDFWDEVLNNIHQEYTSNNNSNEFDIWYGRINYIEDSNSELTVSFPSEFMFNLLNSKGYIQNIKDRIKVLTSMEVTIKPIYDNENLKESLNKPSETENNLNNTSENDEIPAHNSSSDNFSKQTKNPEIKKHPQLKEEYTFERFVVGENNEYAYSASVAVSKEPGKKYNPLLIYGGTGLGKTHLMQSIGNFLYNNPPEGKENLQICYTNLDNLLNEFTKSLRDRTMEKFTRKYRNLDVLLIDDIQFLSKKEGLQNELFYTFEALSQKNGQMVFTCDKHISELKDVEERLISRFSQGNAVDLQSPNYETRKAILEKKSQEKGISIDEEILDFIAKSVKSNVRELEGCLNKLLGYAELLGKPLTMEIAKKQLSDSIKTGTDESVTIDTIIKVVCNYYNITIADIKGTARNPKFAMPRHIAVYLARKMTDRTFTEIAGELGGRDHTTIMNSNKKIESLLQTDESMNDTLEIIKNKIMEYKKI
ncbi:chromosomal replication initiator protein DnaA [Treponema sp.]|uniref:chromosomal replication initiator protein DnaA n=1 Tax=Treponema sp. TaxID=166 RepID=UPI00298E2B4B|nr:chromosomal replication initiator protein DnaA [Treponema sp.]MCQ2241745.1 chromosomal replication initiator protein DnaA [Treponema sp.]